MLFTKDLVAKILDGTKTQTRRLVQWGDIMARHNINDGPWHIFRVERYSRRLWEINRTYAIQPGRGKKAVARFKLTGIRREDLRLISPADALAEGVDSNEVANAIEARTAFADLWDSINKVPGTRWKDNPEVWILDFELA